MSDILAGAAVSADVTEAPSAGQADLLAEFRAVEKELGAAAEEPHEAEAEPAAKLAGEEPAPTKKPESDGKPTVKERAQFRQERREWKQAAAAREQQLIQYEQRVNARNAEVEQAIKAAKDAAPATLKALVDSGQMDELAKSLGHESWEKLNDHAARLFASPEYRRVRQLEEETKKTAAALEAQKAERAKERADWEARQAQLQHEANEKAAVAELTAALKSSDDAATAKLAERDPRFVRAVLVAIQANEDLDIDEAAQQVRDVARQHRDLLNEVFGSQAPSKPEAGKPATPDRAGSRQQLARPNKHVSRQTASEAAPPANSELSDAEWRALAIQEMKKAARADAETGSR